MELYLRKHNQMQAAKCSTDVKGDRVCSKWAAASCVLALHHDAWLPVREGCFSEMAKGVGGTGSFLSEIWTCVHFRVYSFLYSFPQTLASLGWLTIMLKITSWLHSFVSLCLRLISCKFSFFGHFAMSFSKFSLGLFPRFSSLFALSGFSV